VLRPRASEILGRRIGARMRLRRRIAVNGVGGQSVGPGSGVRRSAPGLDQPSSSGGPHALLGDPPLTYDRGRARVLDQTSSREPCDSDMVLKRRYGEESPLRTKAGPQMSRLLPRVMTTLLLLLIGAIAGPASASAAVEWSADAERPWNEEWANHSCQSGDRVSQVSAPRAQGERAYRIDLQDGDYSYGERCELGQANPTRRGFPLHQEGQERWVSYQVRLPDEYPIETSDWNGVFQLKGVGDGGPPVNMAVKNGRFILKNSPYSSSTCCERDLWSGPATRNRWVKFTVHVKFSPDPDVGFVELYGDLDGTGQKILMPKKHVFTMRRDESGRAVPSHSRIGIYRNPRISGNAHVFFDGYTVATDRASAERRAFGSSTPTEPPSPEPSAPAQSRIDWTGDAERPWNDEWANYSCQSSSRFSRVSTPSPQRERAYRIEVRDGDDSYGERCELAQGNPGKSGFPTFEEGEERWISYQVNMPNSFPVDTNGRWNGIFALRQNGDLGAAAISMEVRNGRFHLNTSQDNGSSGGSNTVWSARAQRNRWVKFTTRVKFSPDPTVGFVELYGDLDGTGNKLLMARKMTHTMKRDSAGRAVPSHSRIGISRDPGISGTAAIYFDGYTVATDRQAAEQRAF